MLANNAEQNSDNDIADAAYAGAIKIAPKNREAYVGRLRIALAAGQTARAQKIAADMTQLWPDDAAARNQDAYLRLLLGASGEAAESAERDAQVLVAKGTAELVSQSNARPRLSSFGAGTKKRLRQSESRG